MNVLLCKMFFFVFFASGLVVSLKAVHEGPSGRLMGCPVTGSYRRVSAINTFKCFEKISMKCLHEDR